MSSRADLRFHLPIRLRLARGFRLRALSLAAGGWLAIILAACSPAVVSPSPGMSASSPTVTVPEVTVPASVPATQAPATPTLVVDATRPLPSGPRPCTAADVKVSHGIVEGAAGARLTELVLEAAASCALDASPALGLRDANNKTVVSAPSTAGGELVLAAGKAYTTTVKLDNWCAAEPAFPVQLLLLLADDEIRVTGGSFPEDGDLPPCNGAGGPSLAGAPWAEQP